MAVTNTLKIRQANSSDVDTAVTLLLLSAHRVLTQIFGNGDKPTAEAYLTYAWQHKRGQYGSDAHWVAVDKDTPVGLITVWHNTMPKDFGKETLHSLNTFFGIDEAAQVFSRSASITENLPPPVYQEVIFGHLAVLPEHQGRGIGTQLVKHVEEHASFLEKRQCSLDVEKTNTQAINFYESLGYAAKALASTETHAFIRMSKNLPR